VRRPFVVGAGFIAVLVVSGVAVGCSSGGPRSSDDASRPSATTTAAAQATAAFFSRYVSPDGRVVRHDQGGDTVSEGQAYAMLLAVAANDATRFSSTWSWTREHLQRDDGLVSWRWQNGHVADVNSAADADLDIAQALLLAAEKFGQDSYAVEGRRIATAVLDLETVQVAGRLILVAGQWAITDRVVNPSYVARCDFDQFERATADGRWTQLRTDSYELLGALMKDGLPPDWAVVDSAGRAHPVAGPDDHQQSGRYGLDAARIPARLAECDAGRGLAGALWPRLQALDGDGAAIAYGTDGRRLDDSENPLGLVASALAADAAGDRQEAQRRIDAALQLDHDQPTYYGSAWVAFGSNTLAVHDGRSVQRGAINVGALRFSVVGRAALAPTTTIAPANTAPPAASVTATTSTTRPTSTSTSSTTLPSTSTTSTSVPTTTRATTRPSTTLAPTTRTTSTTTTARAINAGSTNEEPPSRGNETGDLSSPAMNLAIAGAERGIGDVHAPEESSRRRTGAITIGGVSVIAGLGVALGLRERSIVRRRAA
jgi:endoglucanase